MRFRVVAINRIVGQIFSIGAGIILAIFGFGYWALVVRRLLLHLCGAIGSWIFCGWRPGLPSFNSNIWPLLKFTFNTYGSFVLNYIRRNIDKILIGRVIGTKQLGFYDRAYYLSTMLLSQLSNRLANVGASTLSKLRDNPTQFIHYYSRIVAILSFIGLPLSVMLTFVGYDVIILLLGSEWDYTGKIFTALCPGIGISILYYTYIWLHISLGRADRWFRWGIFESIFSVLALIIGLKYGVIGVAIAYSVSFFILIGPAIWYAGKPIELKYNFIFLITWKYFFSSILSGVVYFLIIHKIDYVSNYIGNLNILVRILVLCIFYVPLYLGTIICIFQSIKPISSFITLVKETFPSLLKLKK